jgi:hypothetical protein
MLEDEYLAQCLQFESVDTLAWVRVPVRLILDYFLFFI